MDRRTVLLLCLAASAVTAADHPELRGEHPDQDDIDNGECIPIPCAMGVPPRECKMLCDSRNYETICQPPADFCLCRHMVHGKPTLVSPDEVMEQPLDSEEIKKSKTVVQQPSKAVELPEQPKVNEIPKESKVVEFLEQSKAVELPEQSKVNELPEQSKVNELPEESKIIELPEQATVNETQDKSTTDGDEGTISFQFFAVLLPVKQFFLELPNEESTPEPDLLYETVNVHEGRLFWDFRYILTGLLLLMIGLVVYELVMCALQIYGNKNDLSIKCESSQVEEVKCVAAGNEKILNV